MEKTQEFDDEIEIDLRELLAVLLSQWLLILVVTVLGGGIAFGISHYMIVPQYESTSQLYVLSKSTSITSLADIQTGTSLTNDYMVVVEGRPVLEQVIVNLSLNETYRSLKDKVTLNNPANSRILEITVRDENPAMAKKIADEIADVGSTFIAAKMVQDAPMIIQKGYADGEPVTVDAPEGRYSITTYDSGGAIIGTVPLAEVYSEEPRGFDGGRGASYYLLFTERVVKIGADGQQLAE